MVRLLIVETILSTAPDGLASVGLERLVRSVGAY
jgi:hypothetical protein